LVACIDQISKVAPAGFASPFTVHRIAVFSAWKRAAAADYLYNPALFSKGDFP